MRLGGAPQGPRNPNRIAQNRRPNEVLVFLQRMALKPFRIQLTHSIKRASFVNLQRRSIKVTTFLSSSGQHVHMQHAVRSDMFGYWLKVMPKQVFLRAPSSTPTPNSDHGLSFPPPRSLDHGLSFTFAWKTAVCRET